MLKHYVEFLYPGSFMSETEVKNCSHRDPKRMLKAAGKQCFAFRFFDQEVVNKEGEELRGKAKNYSGHYYPNAEILTIDDVKALTPRKDYKILISNLEMNDWDPVVRTQRGNFQPFGKNDEII